MDRGRKREGTTGRSTERGEESYIDVDGDATRFY